MCLEGHTVQGQQRFEGLLDKLKELILIRQNRIILADPQTARNLGFLDFLQLTGKLGAAGRPCPIPGFP